NNNNNNNNNANIIINVNKNNNADININVNNNNNADVNINNNEKGGHNSPKKKAHLNNSLNGNHVHSCNYQEEYAGNVKMNECYSSFCRLSSDIQYNNAPQSDYLEFIKAMFINMPLEQKKIYFVEISKKVNAMIKEEVIKGIPDHIRGFVWQILVQSYAYREGDNNGSSSRSNVGNNARRNDRSNDRSNRSDKGSGSYNRKDDNNRNERSSTDLGRGYKYYLSINNNYESAIKKDINRTYPKHILFKNNYEKGQQILFNVLKAYSNYNKDLGYCQGMAFIVATFILYMSEEDAFYMLIALLDKYKLNDLFSSEMPLLNEYLHIFDKLLYYTFPKIHNHLQKENVHSSMYASQWFVTLFSYNINILYAVRIWDIFFINNYTFLFKVSLAFFKLQGHIILTESFEDILNRLKVLSKHVELDMLIKTALELKIKKGLIRKISLEYKSAKSKKSSEKSSNGSLKSSMKKETNSIKMVKRNKKNVNITTLLA
ncbi:GTPase-activating protein, putative, partial [Plasmodium malariae]